MGYCTLYSLEVHGENLTKEIADSLNDYLIQQNVLNYAIYEGVLLSNLKVPCIIFDHEGNAVHWFEHVDDMIACSLAFPDLTFRLHGEGDNQLDIWNKYFHAGKCEECRLIWEMPAPETIKWDDTAFA